MLAGRRLSAGRVARLDRGHQLAMLQVRLVAALSEHERGVAQQGQELVQLVQHLQQIAVVGGVVDGLVQPAIDPRQQLGIVAGDQEVVEQTVQQRDLALDRMLRREARRQSLKGLAQRVELKRLLAAELDGDQAAAGRHL